MTSPYIVAALGAAVGALIVAVLVIAVVAVRLIGGFFERFFNS